PPLFPYTTLYRSRSRTLPDGTIELPAPHRRGACPACNHLHGTTDWFRSQERRSRVEGTNGILKSRLGMRSEAARVCGLTRVSLVLAAWCVAFNLTMADRETRLAATGTTPTRRRRRRRISRAERDDTAALAEPEPTPTTANADRPPTRPPSKPPRRAQLPAALRHLAT